MAERTVQVRIEGRVQGVGYRAFAEMEAHGLGLAGWVRNRRDGSVEAVLAGEGPFVDNMIDACRAGTSVARATRIDIEDADEPELTQRSSGVRFAVLPTA